jgi:hypothetical protein
MTKIAGSGYISQRHGSADPYQNIMDPQHCTGAPSNLILGLRLSAPAMLHWSQHYHKETFKGLWSK